MSADALKSAMDQLYSVDAAGFVGLRKELAAKARADGDKETGATIAGLRKPTVAAAAVNALARENDPPAIPELSDLGERMRTAQAAMDSGALKGLAKERSTLVDDLLARMGDLTAPVRDQAAETLTAALADEQAEAAVTSGHLVNPLSYSGFGEVEVSDAVAVPLRELQDARMRELAEREKKKGSRPAPKAAKEPVEKKVQQEKVAKKPVKEKPENREQQPAQQPEQDLDALQQLVDATATAEREAQEAVDAARTALAEAKDHAARTTRARQLAEDLLDRAREA